MADFSVRPPMLRTTVRSPCAAITDTACSTLAGQEAMRTGGRSRSSRIQSQPGAARRAHLNGVFRGHATSPASTKEMVADVPHAVTSATASVMKWVLTNP